MAAVTSKVGAVTSEIATPLPTVIAAPTTTTPVCTPTPTQAIVNPSFEDDVAGTGTYSAPWVFTGPLAGVESNENSPYGYQSFDGDHFAVLPSTSIATMSQSLTDLLPGKSYQLTYWYNREGINGRVCQLSVRTPEQVIDIFATNLNTGGYRERSVAYTPPNAAEVLTFQLACTGAALQSNFALDAITLTLTDPSVADTCSSSDKGAIDVRRGILKSRMRRQG